MTNTAIDYVAREEARKAMAMIVTHERVCEERANTAALWHSNVSSKLDGINANVRGLYNRIWLAVCSIIMILLGIVGYLIDHKGI